MINTKNQIIILITDIMQKPNGLLVKDKIIVNGKATAYVCKNFTCKLPVTDPENLKKMILSEGGG